MRPFLRIILLVVLGIQFSVCSLASAPTQSEMSNTLLPAATTTIKQTHPTRYQPTTFGFFWGNTTGTSSNNPLIIYYLTLGTLALAVSSVVFYIQKRRLFVVNDYLHHSLEREKQLGEMKSHFVSTASHQFRTPLAVIKSSLGVVEMQKDALDERVKPAFERMTNRVYREINTMTNLMDQVLVMGKLNDGSLKPTFEEIDLVAFAAETCETLNCIQQDDRQATWKINGIPFPVQLDRTLLNHALTNLLCNAFKYSPNAKAPELSIDFKANKHVTITVTDFGIGIPSHEIDKVFIPFFRASNVNGFQGTGLGTAVVKDYVEIMGGTITINSTEGKGSQFMLAF